MRNSRSPFRVLRVTLRPRLFRVAGIDPGAHTGLVCLQVPAHTDASLSGARWVGSANIQTGHAPHCTGAENDARLFRACRTQLLDWGVERVALEEPWDAVPARLQSRGTSFALGRAYGLLLAAATSLGLHCMSYPVTSADARMNKGTKRQRLVEARTGWMPTWRKNEKGALLTQDRTITLAALDTLSRELRMRPADGVLLAASARALPLLSEDERMALGVLRFHLSRQPLWTTV